MSAEHDDEFSGDRELAELEEMFRFAPDDPHLAPEGDLARRRYVDAVLAASASYRPKEEAGRRGLLWRVAAVGAAGAGIAAAAILVFALSAKKIEAPLEPVSPGPQPHAPALRVIAGSASVEAVRGEVASWPRISDERFEVCEESALFSWDGRIALFAARGTRFRAHGAAERVDIELESGEILAHVDPTAHPPGIAFATRGFEVEVTGTVLLVSAEAESPVVEVLRGSVDVDSRFGHGRIAAGESMGSDGARGASIGERAALLLDAADRMLAEAQGREVQAVDSAYLDEMLLDVSPVTTSGEGEAKAVATPASGRRQLPGEPVSARDLMAAAREARGRRDWSGAAERYRELIGRHPSAGEAGVALVDLGNLELDRLGRPGAALDSFDRYLASNRHGPLVAEALWGKANALRALGRGVDERAALEELVRDHPEAFQATEARQRLEPR